ncbi:MAG: hypothetical protein LUG24_00020 [Clostridiales bacterium]|nr:hypothetical protein [Clostridiales bacterium]
MMIHGCLKEINVTINNWELDTVVGKQGTKTVLLVLTERMTRQEIIIKLAAKSENKP